MALLGRTVRIGIVALLLAAGGPDHVPTAFHFEPGARPELHRLWEGSLRAKAERVACLAGSIDGDTVRISRVLPLEVAASDSLGVSARASLDTCGPPSWRGTVHTHVALRDGGRPYSLFSGADRGIMMLWWRRWGGGRNLLPAVHRGGGHLRNRGAPGRGALPSLALLSRALRCGSVLTVFCLAVSAPLAAQGDAFRPRASFQFSPEAGHALRDLWQKSLAAREERVACLASSIRNDTVFVTAITPLEPENADSMGISATRSVEQCGPPQWSGTVHTHIALYTDDLPSTRFSGQDRIAMRLWYDRWKSDGVFCLIYSARDAHCEADGVGGGMRSTPGLGR